MNKIFQKLAAVTLLTCLGLGGHSANASDDATATDTAAASDVESANLERAQEANDKAVNEALARVLESTRLELDIRLLDRKSETVAAAN